MPECVQEQNFGGSEEELEIIRIPAYFKLVFPLIYLLNIYE